MEKRNLGLFFSLPMGKRERDGLELSGVDLVMLVKAHAAQDMPYLRDRKIRTIVRLEESDYDRPDDAADFSSWLTIWKDYVWAVICGCEPENRFKWHYGSRDWGNRTNDKGDNPVRRHARAVERMRLIAQWQKVRFCSPGWTHRDPGMAFGPAPDEGPQPGFYPWIEDTRNAYDACTYNCDHIYPWDGSDYDIRERYMRKLNQVVASRHKEVILDEVNVRDNRLTTEEHMARTLNIATATLPIQRVIAMFPFVMNGDPAGGGWSPKQLMNSTECYRQVRDWRSAN
ncbi:MAG TPA: hypothetical protein VGE45_00345 [Chloroflexia bacterium]|jgi:hypothetical protein